MALSGLWFRAGPFLFLHSIAPGVIVPRMKVKFQRNTVAGGQVRSIGEQADIDDSEARRLIAMGKAVPAGIQNRDPEVEGAKTEVDPPKPKARRSVIG